MEIFFEGISEMMDEREREDVLGVGCSPGRLTFLEKWLNYFWVYVPASSSRWNKLLSRWLFLRWTLDVIKPESEWKLASVSAQTANT